MTPLLAAGPADRYRVRREMREPVTVTVWCCCAPVTRKTLIVKAIRTVTKAIADPGAPLDPRLHQGRVSGARHGQPIDFLY